jgi:phenylalanine-4-hydroxylase
MIFQEETHTPEQFKTWHYLLNAQWHKVYKNTLSRWEYGSSKMHFTQPIVIENISIPHWRILPINGKSSDAVFFDRLSKSIFNVNTYLRSWEERDYLPTRCRWHDSFGHLPWLYDEEYSSMMRLFGVAYNEVCGKPEAVQISKLYWYTVEFGLINIQNMSHTRILGAGIISSPSETNRVLELIERGDMQQIVRMDQFDELPTDYETETFQPKYLLVKGIDEIKEKIINILKSAK